MKKLLALLLAAVFAFLLCACGNDQDSGKDTSDTTDTVTSESVEADINITEKMYVTYINEIYTNTSDYVGKTIKIEGMFLEELYRGKSYYYVYRSGPGCCGNDGAMCGFEFTTDGEYPEDNDWIEVVGKLRTYEEDNQTYLTLDAQSVRVLDVRGAEIVGN